MTIDVPLLLILGSALLVAYALIRSEGKDVTAWAVALVDAALLWAKLK